MSWSPSHVPERGMSALRKGWHSLILTKVYELPTGFSFFFVFKITLFEYSFVFNFAFINTACCLLCINLTSKSENPWRVSTVMRMAERGSHSSSYSLSIIVLLDELWRAQYQFLPHASEVP